MEQEIEKLIDSDLFKQLDEKSQCILHQFYIEKKTIDEIAKDFDEPKTDIRATFTKATAELITLHKRSTSDKEPITPKTEQPIFEIIVKESQLNLIRQDADKIIINNNAEIHLLKLLELQKLVEDTLAYCKERLAEKAAELDPDFKAIVSDSLKIMYRAYGSKYGIDESQIDQVPEELLIPTRTINADKVMQYLQTQPGVDPNKFLDTSYSLDTKALDKYMKNHPTLPVGIKEYDRKKQLSITLKKSGVKDGE